MSVLEKLAVTTAPIIITGDVNVPLQRPDDPLSRKFNDVIASCDLVNHITVPTHDDGGLLDVATHQA